ncbi:MAG: tagaturonate reductase [Thermoflavifilum sp.]|nr:tagaturonate reductase [Thermoflavifilum sp.]
MESLNRHILSRLSPQTDMEIPDPGLLDLPETVLQFGTGVLLRGLPDYFIDKANKAGLAAGRILVVKSTSRGDTDAFDRQDGLYTLCVQGMENGQAIEKFLIQATISRVLSAQHEWQAICDAVKQKPIRLIISNTTEVGISLDDTDDPLAMPPRSFPGKLLAVLLARYQSSNAHPDQGFVIIPTELIPDNGQRLQQIVVELAKIRRLPAEFIDWIEKACVFCNSLVDRIVPGKLPESIQQEIEARLGYRDELMIQAEPYRLWAIEASDERVQQVIHWSGIDEGLVLAADITRFRELKLRLLNGTHTFCCGLAYFMGLDTVTQAMQHPDITKFLHQLIFAEMIPAMISPQITREMAESFAQKVLERFANPYLKHHWIDITVEYTAKMRMRNVPLLLAYYQRMNQVPMAMALGFAAYLLFMRGEARGQHYVGAWAGNTYPIRDSQAAYFAECWKKYTIAELVKQVLGNVHLWQTDLTQLPGFTETVIQYVDHLQQGRLEICFHQAIEA